MKAKSIHGNFTEELKMALEQRMTDSFKLTLAVVFCSVKQDIEAISSLLGGLKDIWNVPMAGFYSYGEFGRAANERHEFHSTTILWTTLKEK